MQTSTERKRVPLCKTFMLLGREIQDIRKSQVLGRLQQAVLAESSCSGGGLERRWKIRGLLTTPQKLN